MLNNLEELEDEFLETLEAVERLEAMTRFKDLLLEAIKNDGPSIAERIMKRIRNSNG